MGENTQGGDVQASVMERPIHTLGIRFLDTERATAYLPGYLAQGILNGRKVPTGTVTPLDFIERHEIDHILADLASIDGVDVYRTNTDRTSFGRGMGSQNTSPD